MAETVFMGMPKRLVGITIDGRDIDVTEGSTILDACRRLQADTPTLCQLENLTPANVRPLRAPQLDRPRALAPPSSPKPQAATHNPTPSQPPPHTPPPP